MATQHLLLALCISCLFLFYLTEFLLEGSGSQSLMKQKARGRLGLLSSEDLSGAGGSISNMAHPNNCW